MALGIKPDDAATLRLHAEVLLELGQFTEALAAFNRFIASGKADAEVYRRRARARRNGRPGWRCR